MQIAILTLLVVTTSIKLVLTDVAHLSHADRSYLPPPPPPSRALQPVSIEPTFKQGQEYSRKSPNYRESKPRALVNRTIVSVPHVSPLHTYTADLPLNRQLFTPAAGQNLEISGSDHVVYATAPNSVFHTQINVQSQGSEYNVPNALPEGTLSTADDDNTRSGNSRNAPLSQSRTTQNNQFQKERNNYDQHRKHNYNQHREHKHDDHKHDEERKTHEKQYDFDHHRHHNFDTPKHDYDAQKELHAAEKTYDKGHDHRQYNYDDHKHDYDIKKDHQSHDQYKHHSYEHHEEKKTYVKQYDDSEHKEDNYRQNKHYDNHDYSKKDHHEDTKAYDNPHKNHYDHNIHHIKATHKPDYYEIYDDGHNKKSTHDHDDYSHSHHTTHEYKSKSDTHKQYNNDNHHHHHHHHNRNHYNNQHHRSDYNHHDHYSNRNNHERRPNYQGVNLINGNIASDVATQLAVASTPNDFDGNRQGVNIINGNIFNSQQTTRRNNYAQPSDDHQYENYDSKKSKTYNQREYKKDNHEYRHRDHHEKQHRDHHEQHHRQELNNNEYKYHNEEHNHDSHNSAYNEPYSVQRNSAAIAPPASSPAIKIIAFNNNQQQQVRFQQQQTRRSEQRSDLPIAATSRTMATRIAAPEPLVDVETDDFDYDPKAVQAPEIIYRPGDEIDFAETKLIDYSDNQRPLENYIYNPEPKKAVALPSSNRDRIDTDYRQDGYHYGKPAISFDF